MLKEFREFVLRGNVIDLAIGVIIGAAFGEIVKSLVNDIIMPPLGLLLNNVNFTDLKYTIGGDSKNPVTFNYGNFIQNVVIFLITAVAIFFLIKLINMAYKKEEEKTEESVPSKEEILLTQIRDLLKEKK